MKTPLELRTCVPICGPTTTYNSHDLRPRNSCCCSTIPMLAMLPRQVSYPGSTSTLELSQLNQDFQPRWVIPGLLLPRNCHNLTRISHPNTDRLHGCRLNLRLLHVAVVADACCMLHDAWCYIAAGVASSHHACWLWLCSSALLPPGWFFVQMTSSGY